MQIDVFKITKEVLDKLNSLENTLSHVQAKLAGAATEVIVDVNVNHNITGDYSEHGSGYLATGFARINLERVGTPGVIKPRRY